MQPSLTAFYNSIGQLLYHCLKKINCEFFFIISPNKYCNFAPQNQMLYWPMHIVVGLLKIAVRTDVLLWIIGGILILIS